VDTIVVELPAHHKALADVVLAASKELLEIEPKTKGGRTLDMIPIEESVAAAAARLECAMLAEVLRQLDVDAERVVIGGKEHVRVGRYPMTYNGMPGSVSIERSIFRLVAERNGKTVDPIALRAGLVGGAWLPAAARAMAQRLAIGTSREAQALWHRGRLQGASSALQRQAACLCRTAICRRLLRFSSPA